MHWHGPCRGFFSGKTIKKKENIAWKLTGTYLLQLAQVIVDDQ